ncbi:unnamed protein product [Adineta steineri]|uniref:Uncharacterized protein n=1 Tax=Adineta steineri TaxID=433720 RepID=A0A816EXJ6_9BILA|nr:unnamed protein product [Adineta steineri]CAF1651650.1 unnamed protein product [Adineta steineri]
MFIHNTPAAYYGRSIKITSDILEKWYSEFNNTIEEFQKYLLHETVDNQLFACWSIRVKYRETFIKTIIKWVCLFDYILRDKIFGEVAKCRN